MTGQAELASLRRLCLAAAMLVAGVCIGWTGACAQTAAEEVKSTLTFDPAGAVPLNSYAERDTLRWRAAPRGTQTCDGVTFVCNGAIRTAGLKAARDGKKYPGAVLGIPVERRGTRIHLLQAAENAEAMTEGVPYVRLIVHSANGESRRFDLLLGVHGENWLLGKDIAMEPVADPNSRVAWSQRRAGDGMIVRAYHTVLENPFPQTSITAIDFIAPLTEANLLVFGLTIDDDPRPLAFSHGPGEVIADAPIFDRISVVFEDVYGVPAGGAELAWTAVGPRFRIPFPPFVADKNGQIILEVPRRIVREIEYRASVAKNNVAVGCLKPDSGGVFPAKQRIRLGPIPGSGVPPGN